MAGEFYTKNGYNFYHVASAFQKCIRRGMEHDALYWGTELYKSGQANYAWFRMQVIVSEDCGLANPTLPAQIEALYQTYLRFKEKGNKHDPQKLQFVHAILLLVRSKKSRLVDNKLCYYFDLEAEVKKPGFPDFVFDQHTREGRAKGRGNEFFYEESAKIENWGQEEVPDEFEFRDMVRALYLKRDGKAASPVAPDEDDAPPMKEPATQMSLLPY